MPKLLLASFLVFLGFFASCSGVDPTRAAAVIPPPPASWTCPARTIRVSFSSEFTTEHQKLGVRSLSLLKDLGITARVVDWHPDVTVRTWYHHECRADHMIGLYTWYTPFTMVDQDCIRTERQFEAINLHELGHWLGMRHICEEDGRTTDSCSPVGRGSAMMNPYVAPDHDLNFTRLDLQEYRLACWRRLHGQRQ